MSATTDRPLAQGEPTARSAGPDASLGELVAHATADLSQLLRQELALAKAEIRSEVVSAGKGAGMLGGAGFSGVLGLIFLSISGAYGLSWLGLPLGWGFFVVGLLYVVAAAGLALGGKKNLAKVGPPERTIESVKDDLEWAKHPTRTT